MGLAYSAVLGQERNLVGPPNTLALLKGLSSLFIRRSAFPPGYAPAAKRPQILPAFDFLPPLVEEPLNCIYPHPSSICVLHPYSIYILYSHSTDVTLGLLLMVLLLSCRTG